MNAGHQRTSEISRAGQLFAFLWLIVAHLWYYFQFRDLLRGVAARSCGAYGTEGAGQFLRCFRRRGTDRDDRRRTGLPPLARDRFIAPDKIIALA